MPTSSMMMNRMFGLRPLPLPLPLPFELPLPLAATATPVHAIKTSNATMRDTCCNSFTSHLLRSDPVRTRPAPRNVAPLLVTVKPTPKADGMPRDVIACSHEEILRTETVARRQL